MHLLLNDFTDPWREADTVLRCTATPRMAGYGSWVPHLARHFRVVRPDMRGFAIPSDAARYAWALDVIVDDSKLIRTLALSVFPWSQQGADRRVPLAARCRSVSVP